MFTRFRYAIALAILLALGLVLPAFAGGWAVITLDELPSNVVMGESITVGFMVLQHGRTPMTGLYPIITANSDHEEFLVTAEPEGKPGHYTAILTFPQDGDWQWSIQAFTMQQAMPVLRVTPVAVVSANPPVARTKSLTSFVSPVMIASVLLALGLVGAVITYRRRSRQACSFDGIQSIGRNRTVHHRRSYSISCRSANQASF